MTRLMYRLFGNPEPCRGGWEESRRRGNCSPGFIPYFPLQPLNTWSNLAYGIAGLAVLILGSGSVAVVQAACLGVLMVGSGLYHGWPTERTNRLDHLGMHLTFAAIAGAAVDAATWAPDLSPATVALLAGAWGLVGIVWRPDVNKSMAVLLGGIWVVSAFPGWSLLMAVSALLLLLSYAVWVLDHDNDGWLVGRYGHLLWHNGTAIALTLMALAVNP